MRVDGRTWATCKGLVWMLLYGLLKTGSESSDTCIHIRPRITSLFIHSLRAEPVHLSSVSQYNQCLVLVVKLVLWVIPVGWLCWCRGWCGLLKLPLTTGTLNAAAALPANSGTLWSDTGAWTSRQRRCVSSAPRFHHTKQRCCLHSNSILSILTCYLLLSPHSASAHDRCGIVSRFEMWGGWGRGGEEIAQMKVTPMLTDRQRGLHTGMEKE